VVLWASFALLWRADFLEALNEDGLWDLVRRYDDRGATAACRLCVADLRATSSPSATADVAPPLLLFTGVLAGGCVAPRGDVRHGKRSWNSLFVPAEAEGGDGRTFGEMALEEQSRMSHRNKAIAAFLEACGPPADA
jgi:inosine triphosphate pyrophosphatase